MHIKPSNIFYSQHQISATFGKWNRHRNTTIGETLDDLCNGHCKISDIERIKVVKKDGKWYSIDNRRLRVFHHLEAAGKCTEIPVEIVEYCSLSHGRKFTSTNGGKSVRIIRGRCPGGKWYRRLTPVIPVPLKEEPVTPSEERGETVSPLKENEDKLARSGSEVIVNNKNSLDKNRPPCTFSFKKPLDDIIDTNKTVSQNARVGLLKPIKEVIGSTNNENSTALNTTSIFQDTAVVRMGRINHTRSYKPTTLIGKFTSKPLITKYYQHSRYKPYKLPFKIGNEHCPRDLKYIKQYEELRKNNNFNSRKFLSFEEDETGSVASDSSENDWLEDDIAMLVDEREITDVSDDEHSDIDGNSEYKEIDYDDDPWSEDISYDTGPELEYDELDVWESDFNENVVCHSFPDSESSDSEDVFLISKELENIEKRKQRLEDRRLQKRKYSKCILNDKRPFTTAQSITPSTDSILKLHEATCASGVVLSASDAFQEAEIINDIVSESQDISQNSLTSSIVTSNDSSKICLHELPSDTKKENLPVFHVFGNMLPTTKSPRLIKCANVSNPEFSEKEAVSLKSTCFVSNYSPSEAALTQLSSRHCSASPNYSISTRCVPSAFSNRCPLNVANSVSTPAIASNNSDSISDESSIETDWSDIDDEDYDENEDSEDYSFSCHYGFADRYDRRRLVREIAIKKYGYDLFDSDSD